MTDQEFLDAFEHCTLPESEWTHRAHVRMAWLYLRQYPFSQALPIVRDHIRQYNASLHKTLAYHETITCAFLRIIAHHLKNEEKSGAFDDFCDRHPDLLDRQLQPLLVHYEKETLFSQRARETFIEPDRRALP